MFKNLLSILLMFISGFQLLGQSNFTETNIDITAISLSLAGAPMLDSGSSPILIDLPYLNGESLTFRVWRTEILAPSVALNLSLIHI